MNERASLLLRTGLAFAFFYAAGASYFDQTSWIGFFPDFLRQMFPEKFLLGGFSLFEVILGLWLLSGRYQFWAGLVSAGALAGIVMFNLSLMDIVFRDISLVFAALGITALASKK
ncbi:MAG: hypothetical protein AAB930_01365 [Patescibacteria group bacterium]